MNLKNIENILLWILKIGLWIVPFIPLYVAGGMLFPYITGKNFAFRAIIEILLVLWAWLAITDPEYRPKPTKLFKALTIFIVIIFFADLFGPNPFRSFFSNYERMEGFLTLFHLYLYAIILASVFKKKFDWLVFFNVNITASLIISFYALMQKFGLIQSIQGGFRVDSTLGNPAYLAVYMLFMVWILAILIWKYWNNIFFRWFYGAILILESAIIYFTATRGVVLALAGTAILFFLILLFFWNRFAPNNYLEGTANKWPLARKVILAFLIFSFLLPFSLWIIRGTNFVKSNPDLSRLTNYSFKEVTVQSRLQIWKMSLKGFWERPLLGWGQENYYLVFQKYFSPGLYGDEPWFDRSHNVVLDWAVHTGILGLASYLSIFVLVFWEVFKGIKNREKNSFELLILAMMFLSYFLQNLFVFDNITSYLFFFAFIAYVMQMDKSEIMPLESRGKEKFQPKKRYTLATSLSSALLIALLIFSYNFWWKPLWESLTLIQSLVAYQYQAPEPVTLKIFKQALAYDSFGNTEVREQLSSLARGALSNSNYTDAQKKDFLAFTLDQLNLQVNNPVPDVKHLLFLATLYEIGRDYDPSYLSKAKVVLIKALSLSPTKQIIWFELAQVYLDEGNINQAVDVMDHAWSLDKNYTEAGANLWVVALLANRPDVVNEVKSQIKIDLIPEENLQRIGVAEQRVNDYKDALNTYEVLVRKYPDKAEYHSAYAALLGYFGNYKEARGEAEKAVQLDPSLGTEEQQFINSIKGK